MKKIILAAIIALCSLGTAAAQNPGEWSVGPQVGIYTNTGWNGAVLGIGAQARYAIDSHWRVQPSVTAILKKHCSLDIAADVHYLFNLTNRWLIYPQAGLSANDLGEWSCGINLGVGTEFPIATNWDLNAGVKWMLQTHKYAKNPLIIGVGASYKF